jgi:nucleoside-diphosphate-sugar epimerase
LLLSAGYQVTCLHRSTSDRSVLPQPEINWVLGDVSDRQGLTEAMKSSDTLVNIASLGFGHADGIVAAAAAASIKRAIFVSTTAIFTRLSATSKSVRLAAEETIKNSSLAYTILRPTMIYGSPRDRNIWRLIRWLKTIPVFPVMGSGNYLMQPIYVDDVAQAIVLSLHHEKTIAKCYNIAGGHVLTYNSLIDTVGEQLNRRILKIHLPVKLSVRILQTIEVLGLRLPIKSEQIERLNENKNFTIEPAREDFNFQPRSFSEGIQMELDLDRIK